MSVDFVGWTITILGWIGTILISILGAKQGAELTAKRTIEAAEKEFLIKNDKEDIKKAIELSQLFASDIVPSVSYISLLFKHVKNREILDKPIIAAEQCSKLEFDHEEALEFGVNFSDKTTKTPLHIEIWDLEISTFISSRTLLIGSSFDSLIKYNDHIINNSELSIYEQKLIYVNEFLDIKSSLLNMLEHFSMYFITKLANHMTVYQSLHQMFRSVVCMLYFEISKANGKVSDKYFTNIINLFSIWNEEYCKNRNIEEELKNTFNMEHKNAKRKLIKEAFSYNADIKKD